MSRELLKRAADKLRNLYAPPSLVKEIDAFLAQPEPEPVAYMNKDGWIGLYKQGDANIPLYTSPPDQLARVAELEIQLDYERVRLAACSHAALSNTDESVKDRIDNTNQYWSATYGDICAAVDREMALRKQLAALQAKLENGVRVHANQNVDRDSQWLCSHYGSRKDIHNATLILDDGAEITGGDK